MEAGNITKAATSKSFLHSPKLLKHTITFFVTVLFNIPMIKTLTDDFWGLQKNMNCTFPLTFEISTLKSAKMSLSLIQ